MWRRVWSSRQFSFSTSFFQRPMPQHLIPFSSNRGKHLFTEMLASGGLENFFALSSNFVTQSEPAYCGPSTLAMVMNSMRMDPDRQWKGPWRWYAENMLRTCDLRKPVDNPLHGVDSCGVDWDEFLLLSECNGSGVQAFRSTESDLQHFRAAVIASTHRSDLFCVAAFSRRVLGQTGEGHYSPIAGYHPGSDMALVFDVARFKHPPWFVRHFERTCHLTHRCHVNRLGATASTVAGNVCFRSIDITSSRLFSHVSCCSTHSVL